MGADLSRIRHNPLLDFAGVEIKQGAVVLDGDVNELVALLDRRLRALAGDTLGRSAVSQATPAAFKASVVSGAPSVEAGRLYVDGLLAENHGAWPADPAAQHLDPLMGEPAFKGAIAYARQPWLPDPPALPRDGRHLVYLDVWQREVTSLESPELVEIAVGVETSSRLQTVWQLRVLAQDAGNAGCATPAAEMPGWPALSAPSSGRLSTGTFVPPDSPDPCDLPPSGDYRGPENQTYRVEIHDPGHAGGKATFKWSRENASVGSRVAAIVSASELQLHSLGRDDVLRFSNGDWVEILDDASEFAQRGGAIRRITIEDEASRRVRLSSDLPAAMLPADFSDPEVPRRRNVRMRRWDQRSKVFEAAEKTPLFQDLDLPGSPGVIKVPAAGTVLQLENGVTVSFASAGGEGFRVGDFWVFAARTADTSVEKLVNAPPRGVHHHYAWLGIWDVAAGSVTDCRHPWPPGPAGPDCACTGCVTANSHATGEFTIQAAVDRLRDSGGVVCLGAGQYVLDRPVVLAGARSVRIRGQGAVTVVIAPAEQPAFAIDKGIGLAIEELAILSRGVAPAIKVHTALGLGLRRLLIVAPANQDRRSIAIGLSGLVAGATISGNAIFAAVGVGLSGALAQPAVAAGAAPPFLLSALLRIEDNLLWCGQAGVSLEGRFLQTMSTHVSGNELSGCSAGGITLRGIGAPGSSTCIDRNSANVTGPAIIVSGNAVRIEGNDLRAVPPPRGDRPHEAAGIAVDGGLDPAGVGQCQLLSNRIANFTGAAIAVRAAARQADVKGNQVEGCGNGIILDGDGESGQVAVENNLLGGIGDAASELRDDNVLGIGIGRAMHASVSGNIVSRTGLQARVAPLRAGILATSVTRLRVHGNQVVGVGPAPMDAGSGAGIMLRGPFSQVEVSHNLVDPLESRMQDGPLTAANALQVELPPGRGTLMRLGSLTQVGVEAGVLVLGGARPYMADAAALAAVNKGASIFSANANQFAARATLAVVEIHVAGDILFSNNMCEQRGRAASAMLEGRTAIVNGNRFTGPFQPNLQLLATRYTVLGNISDGGILTRGSAEEAWNPLDPPWSALNL